MRKLLNTLIPKIVGAYFNATSYFFQERMAKKAFILFCTPRKGRVRPEAKSFLEDAKDDILLMEDIRIQTYRWKGKGPTLLLMHGWESNTFRWRNLVTRLQQEDYNIVAMDAPAHGNTSGTIFHVPLYANCAQKVIETYKPTHIIGHSIGGMSMLYNQYSFPRNTTQKLVSLGAPSELSDFMRQYQAILGLNKRMMQHLEAHFIALFGFQFADFSTSKFVKEISKKGLLVHDEFDAIAPIWSSEQVHANWKNSIFIKTKGLGHSLHQDKVRDQIIHFLKS